MLTVRETECSNVVCISLYNSFVCFVLSKAELLGIPSKLGTHKETIFSGRLLMSSLGLNDMNDVPDHPHDHLEEASMRGNFLTL